MISQTVSSISSLFSTALWDLANSTPVHSLMLSFYLFLCLPGLLSHFHCAFAKWFWPDLMNGRHDHTRQSSYRCLVGAREVKPTSPFPRPADGQWIVSTRPAREKSAEPFFDTYTASWAAVYQLALSARGEYCSGEKSALGSQHRANPA